MRNLIKKGVCALLTADEAIQALVNDRIFLSRTGDEVPSPFIVTSQFTSQFARTKSGSYLDAVTFRVDCVAKSSDVAEQLAASVKRVLDGAFLPDVGMLFVTSVSDDYLFEQDSFVLSLDFILEL